MLERAGEVRGSAVGSGPAKVTRVTDVLVLCKAQIRFYLTQNTRVNNESREKVLLISERVPDKAAVLAVPAGGLANPPQEQRVSI